MIAVITGDIINSQNGEVNDWLGKLKKALNQYGTKPKQWDIFRGDSFQLRISAEEALVAAFYIKAVLKQSSKHDVRMAIGLGEESYNADSVLESNGSAYVYSGESFENLKRQTLLVHSSQSDFDEGLNLMLGLVLNVADNWSDVVASVIAAVLENSNKSQKEISQLLGKSQSNISESLKRGGYEGLNNVLNYYSKKIRQW